MSWAEQLRSLRGGRFASVEAVVEEVKRRLGDVEVEVSEAPGGYTVIAKRGDSLAIIGVVSSEVRVTGVVLVSPLE
jgi:hypothetical protein